MGPRQDAGEDAMLSHLFTVAGRASMGPRQDAGEDSLFSTPQWLVVCGSICDDCGFQAGWVPSCLSACFDTTI